MVAQNIRLDDFYHIIKKYIVIWVKNSRLSISVTSPAQHLKFVYERFDQFCLKMQFW